MIHRIPKLEIAPPRAFLAAALHMLPVALREYLPIAIIAARLPGAPEPLPFPDPLAILGAEPGG